MDVKFDSGEIDVVLSLLAEIPSSLIVSRVFQRVSKCADDVLKAANLLVLCHAGVPAEQLSSTLSSVDTFVRAESEIINAVALAFNALHGTTQDMVGKVIFEKAVCTECDLARAILLATLDVLDFWSIALDVAAIIGPKIFDFIEKYETSFYYIPCKELEDKFGGYKAFSDEVQQALALRLIIQYYDDNEEKCNAVQWGIKTESSFVKQQTLRAISLYGSRFCFCKEQLEALFLAANSKEEQLCLLDIMGG